MKKNNNIYACRETTIVICFSYDPSLSVRSFTPRLSSTPRLYSSLTDGEEINQLYLPRVKIS